jgi:AcrR family transcriptional regulator
MSPDPRGAATFPPYPAAPSALAHDDSHDARQRILHAAYRLFCRDGVGATGVDRIVADAAVAKMTLYRHFRSKEDLARAVIELRAELFTHQWFKTEIERRVTTPVERILVMFDLLEEWFQREDWESCLFLKCLFETTGEGGPVSEAAVRELENMRALISDLARDAGARDPAAFAYKLQMLISGATVLTTIGDSEAAGRARDVAELLLDQEGLRRSG